MKLRSFCSALLCLILAQASFAQNFSRQEEEAELDRQRREKVEAAIRDREAEAKRISENPELYEGEKSKLVEVEPNNILPADMSNISALIPYKVRRKETGLEVGVGYNMYEPTNYESAFASGTLIDYSSLYKDAGQIEIHFNYKLNWSFGSLGAELAYGVFDSKVKNKTYGDDISLNLQTIRLGGKFIFDMFFYEPVIAPYVSGGLYTVIYDEKNAAISKGGNTQPAPYYAAGVMAQLNWLDSSAAVEGYVEGGIENTYLFAEVRQYMASNADDDPDFSTDPNFGVGLALEF